MSGIVLLLLLSAQAGQSASLVSDSLWSGIKPWSNAGANLYRSFTGWNSLLHVSAAGATYAIMESGADYDAERYFNRHPDVSAAFMPVAITGMVGPVGLSAFAYLRGRVRKDLPLYGAGCALMQANSMSWLYTSTLKSITGRPYPNPYEPDMDQQSRTFRFGFMRGGIFWGWPSGHTAATMATASCLAHYYPEKRWITITGYLWTAYTMVGVAAVGGGHMHWLSDGVAAALMNYAIGSTVGRSFRRLTNSRLQETSLQQIELIPIRRGTSRGLGLAYRFGSKSAPEGAPLSTRFSGRIRH